MNNSLLGNIFYLEVKPCVEFLKQMLIKQESNLFTKMNHTFIHLFLSLCGFMYNIIDNTTINK